MLDESIAGEHGRADNVPETGVQTVAAMSLGDLFAQAEAYEALGDRARSIVLYGAWLAGNLSHPLLHAAYFNYAVVLNKFGQTASAANALFRCLQIAPEFGPAYINLGRILEDDGRAGDAIGQWLTLVDQLKDV